MLGHRPSRGASRNDRQRVEGRDSHWGKVMAEARRSRVGRGCVAREA